jgi:hypothetical protein
VELVDDLVLFERRSYTADRQEEVSEIESAAGRNKGKARDGP